MSKSDFERVGWQCNGDCRRLTNETLDEPAVMFLPGGSGSCRTIAKLGRCLALPLELWTGSFQSAARLKGDVLTLAVSATVTALSRFAFDKG